MLALAFILLIGAVLILDGLDVHVPKPYIYAAMGFSVLVEWLNLLMRRRAREHNVPGAGNWACRGIPGGAPRAICEVEATVFPRCGA
ncbi:hypothetical protein G6F52_014129 [Rhizopus delemar]|uniref:Uncharacterized protein n=1 Tax=Rhizopus oryzae TaxID=64495 RepID=A0A9P6XMW7_RHIOR|nr:hypothetical protein G6F52_014129 [Rhizopus delemar]KAG1526159.1 hypothetical protein G6F51_014341 [Rhizopus arrhizus]